MARPPESPSLAGPSEAFGALLAEVVRRAVSDALAEQFEPFLERLPTAQGSPVEEPLLDRIAFARALGCSLSTVDRLVRQGMPYLKVLDAKRFELRVAKAWLRSGANAGELRALPGGRSR